jgi:nicotinate dehydrogenase subunit A
LRDDLGLQGRAFGCGLRPVRRLHRARGRRRGALVRDASAALVGKKIVTLEGLGSRGKLHPLQQAFIDEQAVQCGYCINGMIMQAAALLQTNKKPTEKEIKAALAENLCRCGTHLRIVRAIKRASETTA